jgi:hypothetical protein
LGSGEAAVSSRVRLTLTAFVLPPTSDMTIAFAPDGPTRSTSMSSGSVWLKPLRTRLTSAIELPRPETTQFDG